jgi:hypothetical protein
MLRRVHEITGMRIYATDADIGHLHDVYLAIRVNRFLVPMSAVRWMSWHTRRIRVTLGGDTNGTPASHGA